VGALTVMVPVNVAHVGWIKEVVGIGSTSTITGSTAIPNGEVR